MIHDKSLDFELRRIALDLKDCYANVVFFACNDFFYVAW